MQNIRRRAAFTITALFLVSIVSPVTTAQTDSNTEYYYGVEYDWASLDLDIENFTGININEILSEVMGAADDADFNLDLAQVNTGSSNVYVHYTEDMTTQTIQDKYGNDVQVWSRSNDVTLRHGTLATAVIMTDWGEQTFGQDPTSFDIDIQGDLEQVLTVDMLYTEYLTDQSQLIGADLDFAMNVELDAHLSIDIALEGGGEELPVDFDASIGFGYEIQGAESEWRLGEPSTLYVDFSSGDNIKWNCDEERYIDEWEWDDTINMNDDCGEVEGDYSATVGYDFSVSGIPTEDLGLDEGQFDLSVSDTLSNTGDFTFEFLDGIDFYLGESLSVDLGNGEMTSVQVCESCAPGQSLMFAMMGSTLLGATEDFGETIADDLEESFMEEDGLFGTIIDMWDIDESGNDYYHEEYNQYWTCDNGDEIYHWEYDNGWEDCSDGSDEPGLSVNVYSWSEEANVNVQYEFEDSLGDGYAFECADGEIIDFSYANDGYEDCSDGSDEPNDSSSVFMCEDGSEISLSLVNDEEADCEYGADEGIMMFTLVVTTYLDGAPIYSTVEVHCHGDYAYYIVDCDESIYGDYISMYDSIDLSTMTIGHGAHEMCVSVALTGENVQASNDNAPCNEMWIGAKVGSLYVYNDDMTMYYDMNLWNSPPEDTTQILLVNVYDEEGEFVEEMSWDIESGTYYLDGEFIAPAEGEYCFEASVLDDDGNAYQSLYACEMAETQPEPSDRLMTIGEAFGDSGLFAVLESFAENLEDRLGDVVADEFPYHDGMWAPMWSTEHATIVGVGVYVADANDEWYILAGPETQGYSDDAPAQLSIRYITGVEAMTAQQVMAESNEISEIVDVENYDLDLLAEALEQAGVDTSNLNLDNGNIGDSTTDDQTQDDAEEAADAAGLPFISPLSVLCMLGLAFIVGRRAENEE